MPSQAGLTKFRRHAHLAALFFLIIVCAKPSSAQERLGEFNGSDAFAAGAFGFAAPPCADALPF